MLNLDRKLTIVAKAKTPRQWEQGVGSPLNPTNGCGRRRNKRL
jgi:hypothetical protein